MISGYTVHGFEKTVAKTHFLYLFHNSLVNWEVLPNVWCDPSKYRMQSTSNGVQEHHMLNYSKNSSVFMTKKKRFRGALWSIGIVQKIYWPTQRFSGPNSEICKGDLPLTLQLEILLHTDWDHFRICEILVRRHGRSWLSDSALRISAGQSALHFRKFSLSYWESAVLRHTTSS